MEDLVRKYDEFVGEASHIRDLIEEIVIIMERAYERYLDVEFGITPPSKCHSARKVADVIIQDENDDGDFVTLRDLLGTLMYVSEALDR